MIRELIPRILVLVGVAVILAALIAEAVGAKDHVEWGVSIDTSSNPGAAMTVFAFSSSGVVSISVEGAKSIYYMKLKGDPMIALRQLSTINISLVDQTLVQDIRAGVAYGAAGLKTNPLLLKALPLLANIIPVEVKTPEGGNNSLRIALHGGQGVLVVVEPDGDRVTFSMEYRVAGYRRLDTNILIASGFLVSVAGLVFYRMLRSW